VFVLQKFLDGRRQRPRMHRWLNDVTKAVALEPCQKLRPSLRFGRDVGLGLELEHPASPHKALDFLADQQLREPTVHLRELCVDRLQELLEFGLAVPQLQEPVGQLKQRRAHAAPLPPAMIWRHSSTTRRLMSRLAARACMMRSSTVPLASRWKYWTFSAVCPARWMRALACS